MTSKRALKQSGQAPKEKPSQKGQDMATPTNQLPTATPTDKPRRKREPNPALKSLRQLETGPVRAVQETFRSTVEEHNQMVERAQKKGYTSMSDFFRGEMGLDPARTAQ